MSKIVSSQFNNDIWDLEEFKIEKSRNNKSNKRKTFRFDYCKNDENKYFLKLYVDYLIKNTDLAISTIYAMLSRMKNFVLFLDKRSLKDVSRNIVLEYYDELEKKNYKPKTYNDFIYKNRNFMMYLETKGLLKETHFYIEDRKFAPLKFTLKKVPQEIINQIFSILDKIPTTHSLIFLIIYSTGMRVSEACQIKIGNTHQLDDGYFIEYYNVKMRKYVTNPISESLYTIIRDREENILKESNNEEVYLFPRKSLTPYNSNTFKEQFDEYLLPYNISYENGEQYKFRPHDFRHTIASEMANQDIPLEIIQSILHHESQQMTLAYIDKSSNEKIKQYQKFINNKGLDAKVNIQTAQLEWLRENLNAQILPNGACSLPLKLGKCPNSNACLTCQHFVTSKEFLDIHKIQLSKTIELIEVSKKNNWIHQVETNLVIKENLESIIVSLEREGN